MGTKKTTNITITNMMSERNICFPVSPAKKYQKAVVFNI